MAIQLNFNLSFGIVGDGSTEVLTVALQRIRKANEINNLVGFPEYPPLSSIIAVLVSGPGSPPTASGSLDSTGTDITLTFSSAPLANTQYTVTVEATTF